MSGLLEMGLYNAVVASILAVLAAGLCRIWRRPALAHALWLLVLLKLLIPPLVAVPLPWFGETGSSVPAAPPEVETAEAPHQDDFPEPADLAAAPEAGLMLTALEEGEGADLSEVGAGLGSDTWVDPVLWLWLAGSLLYFSVIAVSTYRFRRLLRFAQEAGPDIQELVTELAGRLGMRRPPRVWLVPGAVSPMLWAFASRPRVLFPAGLLERLDRPQLQTLVAHELAHWQRRDHWIRALELVVQVVYWWHPVVWWARRELHEAEEQCCDAWVVAALNGAGRSYALALLETAAFVCQTRPRLPATASGIGQVPQLRRRLIMIMSGKKPTLGAAACLAVALFGMTLLPLAPARAQDRERAVDPAAQKAQLDAARAALERQVQELRSAAQRAQAQTAQPSLDDQIQVLRRALQILEEQRRKEKAAPAASAEEINKARAETRKLALIAAQKRAELAKAETELQAARAQLAKLEGRQVVRATRAVNELYRTVPVEPRATNLVELGRAKLPAAGVIVRPAPGQRVSPREQPMAGIILRTPDDLGARLDRLLREVEQLRREIQAGRQPGAPVRLHIDQGSGKK
jgi:beta-lactamase regulating signal transducer with metallopeptidase domain